MMDMNGQAAGAGSDPASQAAQTATQGTAAPNETAAAQEAQGRQAATPPAPEAGKQAATGTGTGEVAAQTEEDMFSGLAPDAAEEEAEAGAEDGEGEGGQAADAAPVEIQTPEGFVTDEAVMGGFLDIVKESGIKQESAQKLFDIYASEMQKSAEAYQQSIMDKNAEINAEWARQCRNDPEFGGENYEGSRKLVMSAIRRFVPPAEEAEFIDFYRKAQLQNNPQMFRFLCRVSKETSEAEAVTDEAPAPQRELSVADRLFPNYPSARQ
jgi:hypothetical protein